MECLLPGSDLLLSAFTIVEEGIRQAIAQRGEIPICGPGCAACCHQPIPATTLELLLLKAYVHHVMPQEQRLVQENVLGKFRGGKECLTEACPFLHDGRCAVYPVRPIACRQYLIFGHACTLGEDPTLTRPKDVLRPKYAFMDAALRLTLPWYRQDHDLPERMSPAAARVFFRSVTTLIQAVPWGLWLQVG
ncbi:MAG: YkgJ family cysteine cluster protein [Desulfovibrio sp.]|nr:YkgJ family cysteine cluster protein [Desulfovibrio sp.]